MLRRCVTTPTRAELPQAAEAMVAAREERFGAAERLAEPIVDPMAATSARRTALG
jgi:hypothetical protein